MIKLNAATKSAGQCVAMVPDVCKTPPANTPLPYPNMSLLATCTGTVKKVLIVHKECVVEGSKMLRSSLDEPGITGGIVSGVNMNQVAPIQFSSTVIAQGKKMVYLTCKTKHNGSNANVMMGMVATTSQMKVLIGM